MKKIIILFVICFKTIYIYSAIFNFENVEEIPLFKNFYLKKTGEIKLKINDSFIKIQKYKVKDNNETILNNLYLKIKSKNYLIIDSNEINKLVEILANLSIKNISSYTYISYIDKNNINFIIKVDDDFNTYIIKTKINKNILKNKFKGFKDCITHFPDSKKLYSIEILNKKNKTIHFNNFYLIKNVNLTAIINFYKKNFKIKNWNLIYENTNKKISLFIIKKKKIEYFVFIINNGEEKWISVSG